MQAASDRQLKVKPMIGKPMRVNETYAGDFITLDGQRCEISREAWEDLKRAAGSTDPQSYVTRITKGLSGEAARRALRRALKRDVPKELSPIVTRAANG